MTAPLREMAACAHHFARGRFDVRVSRYAERGDETGELASAFNAMADSLEKAEEVRRGFIANVSHELKTPMTTIAGYIDGILDGTVPPARERETLGVVRDEVMRLSRLVRRMVELSRLETGALDLSPQVFDAAELMRRVLLGFEGRIEDKRLDVQAELSETEVKALADPDSIVQVLTNLLDNAVKFADEGGLLALSLYQKAGVITISVKNSGATIPEEDLPFVFERFYKADRSRSSDRKGLGLGLFLVKSLLGAQGQTVAVHSKDGVTEFRFTLASAR
jgi:signal transduction histidine kinase